MHALEDISKITILQINRFSAETYPSTTHQQYWRLNIEIHIEVNANATKAPLPARMAATDSASHCSCLPIGNRLSGFGNDAQRNRMR